MPFKQRTSHHQTCFTTSDQRQNLVGLRRSEYHRLYSQLGSLQTLKRRIYFFDTVNDGYTCTAKGVLLPYKKTYQDNKGYYKKQYRSSANDCGCCPLRTACIGGRADYKKLEETIDKPLYDAMHQRLQTPYARRMKKLRHSTVEPVLGTLINFMGLRRIWTRGIANANKFMLGAVIAYNLKKWLNYDQKKRKTAIMSLKKGLNDLNILFLTVQLPLATLNTKK